MYLIKMKGEFIDHTYSNRLNVDVSVINTRHVSEGYNPHYNLCLSVTKLKDGDLGIYIKNSDYKKNEEILKNIFTIDNTEVYLFDDSGEFPIFKITEVKDIVKVKSKESTQNITSEVNFVTSNTASRVSSYVVKVVDIDKDEIEYALSKIEVDGGVKFVNNDADLFLAHIYNRDEALYLVFYADTKNDVFVDDLTIVDVYDGSEIHYLPCAVINSKYINKPTIINAFKLIGIAQEEPNSDCIVKVTLTSTARLDNGDTVYLELNDKHHYIGERPMPGRNKEIIDAIVPATLVRNIVRSFLANGFITGQTKSGSVLVTSLHGDVERECSDRYVRLTDKLSFEDAMQPNTIFKSPRDAGLNIRSFDDTVMMGHRHGSRSGDRMMSFHRGGRLRSNVGDNQYRNDVLSRYTDMQDSVEKIYQLRDMVDKKASNLISDLIMVDSQMTTPALRESTIDALEEELNRIVVCLENALR